MHRPFVALLPQFQVHLIRVSSSENEATRAASERASERGGDRRMRMAPRSVAPSLARLLKSWSRKRETTHNTADATRADGRRRRRIL